MANRKRIINFMKLEFPSLSANKKIATYAIDEFARQMTPDPTFDDISNINTAMTEALDNALIHAYPDHLGTITIKATIFNGNILEIRVIDKGPGIQNIEKARKPFFTTGGFENSGMGFTIMESFMTSVDVRSTPEKGTTVIMQYHITRQSN